MCGRFTVTREEEEIIKRFEVQDTFRDTKLVPRFNVAPSQSIAVIVNKDGRRTLETYKWGLIPFWVKDLKKMKPMINARGETLIQKPFFKTALSRRRCLIPADGFYEWKQEPGIKRKTPMYIHLPNREMFAFAGLWDQWTSPDGEVIRSCTIITTDANKKVSGVHDRMPVILPPEAEAIWLDNTISDPGKLLTLIQSCPDEQIDMYEVSTQVNSSKMDLPTFIDKAAV